MTAGRLVAQSKIGRYRVSIQIPATSEADGTAGTVSLESLLERVAPTLDRHARRQLFAFVHAQAVPYLDQDDALPLAHGLRTIRDRLAEDAPELPAKFSSPPLLVVDMIVALDERRFWVFGWSRESDGTPSDVTLISPEGHRVQLLPGAPRFDRADVAESLAATGSPPSDNGFAKLFELEAPSLAADGWQAELGTPGGTAFRIAAPQITRDPREARGTMVWPFASVAPELEIVRRDHAFPALERFQRLATQAVEIASEVEHGAVPQGPDVSLIVPLYRRIDLIEHQLAQFWRDPDLAGAELIYVLDSPEQEENLNRLAAPLQELYGLPFKVITLNRNGGYAVANNLGASRARGRLLMLMNSDVLPVGPGWLGRMLAFHDATTDIGALGPKLLYEDDSIQHAGMYFQRDAASRLWENQHYFKGFARTLPAANVSRPVPGVTGACMLVERDLFDGLGGFSTVYVEGGYEDSDFCVRVAQAGRRNWYLADVELYHLEAQSFFIHTRLANPCNAWIQTHLWNDEIEALMRAEPAASDARLMAVS